jgi:hypothetical protein
LLTHAGGSASVFVPWAKALAPKLELFGVQLPSAIIQEILGHTSLDETQVYTRVSIGHLKGVHA